MRKKEEKLKIIQEYYKGNISTRAIAEKYGTTQGVFNRWKRKYENTGNIFDLESKTGKKSGGNKGRPNKPKTEAEELKRKITKLEIEVARLKKGYQVKGVGATKEYVTILEKNTK